MFEIFFTASLPRDVMSHVSQVYLELDGTLLVSDVGITAPPMALEDSHFDLYWKGKIPSGANGDFALKWDIEGSDLDVKANTVAWGQKIWSPDVPFQTAVDTSCL